MSEPDDSPGRVDGTDAGGAQGGQPGGASATRPLGDRPRQPSLVPGTVLLVVAAALIVVVLVSPSMPHWLRVAIAIAAVCVVVALLVYAVVVFRSATRRGSGR